MGLLGGGFLRLLQTFLYLLAFGCSAIGLGFYSYFLAVLSDRQQTITNTDKAVEGITGIAVVYTICAVVLTCCLGGVSFFGFIAIVLNVCFAGAFVAVAVLTRNGVNSCNGDNASSPIGTGPSDVGTGFGANGFGASGNSNTTYAVTYGNACRYNKAVWAVSIIAIFLFLILAIVQVFLVRHHKKEKRFGPSPTNNYTSGSGRRKFWQRKRRNTAGAGAGAGAFHTRDPEVAAVDTRPSHDTTFTGSTAAGGHHTGLAKDEPVGTHVNGHSTHGRYYTQPEGTGVNPYGYNNTTTTTNGNHF